MNAIYLTHKTICERLYLVLGLRKFLPLEICPYAPTTLTIDSTVISRLMCRMTPQLFWSSLSINFERKKKTHGDRGKQIHFIAMVEPSCTPAPSLLPFGRIAMVEPSCTRAPQFGSASPQVHLGV